MSRCFCPTVQDFVHPGNLARFVLSLVREAIDLSKITGTYERGVSRRLTLS
jgi:hypothetical protein